MFNNFRQKRRIRKMLLAPPHYTRYTYSIHVDGTARFKDEKLIPVKVKDTSIGHVLVVRGHDEDRDEWIPVTKIGVLNCQPPYIMTGENLLGYESAYRFTYVIANSNVEEFFGMHSSMIRLMKEHAAEQQKFWSRTKKIVSSIKPYVPGKSKGGKIFDIVTKYGTEYPEYSFLDLTPEQAMRCSFAGNADIITAPRPRPTPKGPDGKPQPPKIVTKNEGTHPEEPPSRIQHSNGTILSKLKKPFSLRKR